MVRLSPSIAACLGLQSSPAGAQVPPPGYQPVAAGSATSSTPPASAVVSPAVAAVPTRVSSSSELATLYATAIVYGAGLGVWFDLELDITDPATALIPVAAFGVAAPIGVFALDHPPLAAGVPASIASGVAIGAAEGAVIVGYQRASSADPVGLRGSARVVGIGATLGALGGYALGTSQEPEPESSALTASGVFWGGLVGGMFGFGASPAGVGFGRSDEDLLLGTLVGMNVGLATTAALSTLTVPQWHQLKWMWLGGALGAALASPVFLFYLPDDAPPAKRGFLFMGTATVLGAVAGSLLSADRSERRQAGTAQLPGWARLDALMPTVFSGGGLGVQAAGTLF